MAHDETLINFFRMYLIDNVKNVLMLDTHFLKI
jgi:hypothetical protein